MLEPASLPTLPDRLRGGMPVIGEAYERRVADELPEIDRLGRPAVLDHLPEFLRSLADWVDAHLASGGPAKPFTSLAEGHALQRLSFGIPLETLTREYAVLRNVVLTEILREELPPGSMQALVALDLGFDLAVREAIHRYAAQRDAVRERFIGILGHDLRSPLGAISVSADTLLSLDGVPPNATRVAARIARSVKRMVRMIDDVLDFARSHLGGGIPASPTRNDLGDLCRDAIEEACAAWPDRAIRLEACGDLRGTWDGERMVQALGNLLSNAIAHGADPIVVRAWEADDRKTVFASVTNHGPAIPDDLLPHIFDPFRRGKSHGSSSVGLGLYIVQQIALAHGGECTMRSDDEATVATLAFPRVPVEETPDRP